MKYNQSIIPNSIILYGITSLGCNPGSPASAALTPPRGRSSQRCPPGQRALFCRRLFDSGAIVALVLCRSAINLRSPLATVNDNGAFDCKHLLPPAEASNATRRSTWRCLIVAAAFFFLLDHSSLRRPSPSIFACLFSDIVIGYSDRASTSTRAVQPDKALEDW